LKRNQKALKKPLVVFITFKNSESVNLLNRAIQNNDNKELKVKEAPIPTNIKWEARNRQGVKALISKLYGYSVIVLIMLITHSSIFFARYET
jgi:hypothetical protein